MLDDPVLIHDWHIVVRSTEIAEGQVKAASLLEEDLVLWRGGGQLMAWKDLCVHRGTRLSGGAVLTRDAQAACFVQIQYTLGGA